MTNYLIEQHCYEKMPEFIMQLDTEKIKVIVNFSYNLTISVKNEDLNLFKELVNKNKIDLQLL